MSDGTRARAARSANPDYKILVVDDEPDLERLVKQRMRRHIRSGRYGFEFAGNGIEALEKLTEIRDIDIVLSDINMPKMDGLTLLQQIPEVNADIRSVIVSAYGDMENIRTAMNRGAFDFVTKPIDFADLQVTIDRTLRHLDEWRAALASRDKLVALQNELDVATKIQQSILPDQFPHVDGCEVYGCMEAARNVGGDFFDVIRLEGGSLGLAVADVSDKGVPAALFMMSSRTLLKGAAVGIGHPGAVLSEVNDLLNETNDAAMFVTVFYGVYDPASKVLTFSNGGHNPPLVVHADGSSEELELTGGIALGAVPQFEYGQASVQLRPGDMVVFFTDGVTEAVNPRSDEFGLEAVQALFEDGETRSAQEAAEMILKAVREFAGEAPQFDDLTCMILRVADE
ncbi:MAG: SpoIIE family protein phosphatase [Acidobacteria bacterium]|nr:SpoIIE family protein phosphatase [Acidobacteriota bacterium]